jgi:hypothetical protein
MNLDETPAYRRVFTNINTPSDLAMADIYLQDKSA